MSFLIQEPFRPYYPYHQLPIPLFSIFGFLVYCAWFTGLLCTLTRISIHTHSCCLEPNRSSGLSSPAQEWRIITNHTKMDLNLTQQSSDPETQASDPETLAAEADTAHQTTPEQHPKPTDTPALRINTAVRSDATRWTDSKSLALCGYTDYTLRYKAKTIS